MDIYSALSRLFLQAKSAKILQQNKRTKSLLRKTVAGARLFRGRGLADTRLQELVEYRAAFFGADRLT